MDLAQQLTAAAFEAQQRTRGFRGGVDTRTSWLAFHQRVLAHATATHTHRVADRIAAAVIVAPDPTPWTGTSLTHVVLQAEPAYTGWVIDTLRALGPLPTDAYAQVPAHDRPWLPQLAAVGLHPEAMIQLGEPATALQGLGQGPQHSAFRDHGLDVVPLLPDHVAPLLALKRAWFGEHPEFGWFIGDDAYLASHGADLLSATFSRVIVRDGRVVGLFSHDVSPSTPWGRCAGIDLCFDPTLHGLGLAAPAYRILLTDMLRRGVQAFKGGTSQPGVVRLGRRMGRWPVQWGLRTTGAFPWSHWDEA